jgi:CBS domain-containing protein
MVPAGQLASVAPEDSLLQAFQRIEERGVGLLPVLAEKALVGVVGREDVLRLLAIHAELGAFNPRGLGKGTP